MEFEKEDLNLKLIPFYKNRYGCLVGYSGHEQNIEPSVVADGRL
jgi:N-acetylneuraminate synthase